MPTWITFILPLIREGAEIIKTFTADHGHPPTDAELAAVLTARNEADNAWADAFERLKNPPSN